MTGPRLEERVERLESQVAQLQGELRSVRTREKDWRRTIGAFTDDVGMQDILREAMRLREADRREAHSKETTDPGRNL